MEIGETLNKRLVDGMRRSQSLMQRQRVAWERIGVRKVVQQRQGL